MAAQDFCHLPQGYGEPEAKFISQLQTIFKIVYGKDAMATETHENNRTCSKCDYLNCT